MTELGIQDPSCQGLSSPSSCEVVAIVVWEEDEWSGGWTVDHGAD